MKQKGDYDTDECFNMVKYSPVRIGFDVAQTCVDKAGCGWLADLLIRALVDLAPGSRLLSLSPVWKLD